ncbi:MAG: cell wall hydrolase [Proteobacteria bacterium]|nr:cell wall hydrolase [Pseudomonadota bacterium]
MTKAVTDRYGPSETLRRRLVIAGGWLVALAIGFFLTLPARAGIEMPEAAVEMPEEVKCLALTIYFESRGEPDAGKVAVGHVVMNRVNDPRFPGQVCKVVKQGGEWRRNRCQFSWWCDGRSDKPKDHRAWGLSKELANTIYAGMSEDPTDGALWYHADYVKPYWRNVFARGPKIGRHIFYRQTGDKARSYRLAAKRKHTQVASNDHRFTPPEIDAGLEIDASLEDYLAAIKPAAGAPASDKKPGSTLCWLAADEGAGGVAEEDGGFLRIALFKAAAVVAVPLSWFSGKTGDKIQQGELVLARPWPNFLDKFLFPKKRRALVRCKAEDAPPWT